MCVRAKVCTCGLGLRFLIENIVINDYAGKSNANQANFVNSENIEVYRPITWV